MSEERLIRLEDMMGQLIGMVGKVIAEQMSMKEILNGTQQDVNGLKQDVSVLKQDVSVLKQDVSVLKQDVSVLKQDVSVLKQDVSVLKQDVKEIHVRLTRIESQNAKFHDSIAYLLDKSAEHDRDIHALKLHTEKK